MSPEILNSQNALTYLDQRELWALKNTLHNMYCTWNLHNYSSKENKSIVLKPNI